MLPTLCSRLVLALLPFLLSGCVVSRFAGSKLITAPNQRLPASAWQPMWKYFIQCVGTNPFTAMNLEVGPPSASLRALTIEPADYHRRFTAAITTNNGHYTFTLNVLPATLPLAKRKPLSCLVRSIR